MPHFYSAPPPAAVFLRPLHYNNKAQDRLKTCNEHDNFFNVKPGQDGFPQKVADEAGLEAPWRPLLKKSDARTK